MTTAADRPDAPHSGKPAADARARSTAAAVDAPAAAGAAAETAGADTAGADTAGADTAGADTAGADTAGADTTGADNPAAGAAGVDTPAADAAGTDAAGVADTVGAGAAGAGGADKSAADGPAVDKLAADTPAGEGPAADVVAGERGPRRARGEQTRQLILDTALRLFRERGYAETTMRAIAKEAGVAVGNAYYYFDSKEQLIQGFYDRSQAALRDRSAPILASERDFAARLRGVMHVGIDVNAPYHAFAATFFKTAAEPTSPLSPFSSDSSPAREAAIAVFREVLDGSSAKVDPELRKELPELLWLAWMGVILFWVHDPSPDQRRTRRLIDGAVPLIDRLVGLSRLRVLRPSLRQVLALIDSIRRDE